MDMPEGFTLAAISEREDPRDAFVSNHYLDLAGLPGGARVGTSSPRRQAQLRERDPLLSIQPLRGNVNTRLAKLDRGPVRRDHSRRRGPQAAGPRSAYRIAARSGGMPSRRRTGRARARMPSGSRRRRRRASPSRRSRDDARDDRGARVRAGPFRNLPHAARRARDFPARRALAARTARERERGRRDARREERPRRRRAGGRRARARARPPSFSPAAPTGLSPHRSAPAPLSGLGILVTRPARQAAGFAQKLAALGGEPVIFPAIAILPPADPAALRRAHAALANLRHRDLHFAQCRRVRRA